ncbi:FepA family TonB-dependent siderophore receptor [Pseudorhodoferax sp.]|uniref:FepA family TonB-dependent siderophore receptor n=1 Tax=Pseudorhodoferax sp. TaxID=1993553 RepID=UPI0039E29CF8
MSSAFARFPVRRSVAAVSLALSALPLAAQQSSEGGSLQEIRVLGTAEEELRQSLGVSVITEEDLERRPPANDLAEILRTQPGVNLTGNSASGSYGNQRQIDLRGMGPENTMILIDGKPVLSRSGAMMRRSGERDTHGDTNWVPPDQIERIEIIRGPAAARYGSGAAGGVINIITKKPGDKLAGGITLYNSAVDGGGDTRRLGFHASGPLGGNLAFRIYGNVAKTDGDPVTANVDEEGDFLAAGREGTRNRDLNGLLRWQLTPDHVVEFEAGFSRQGNIYTGESVTGVTDPGSDSVSAQLIGSEVRRVYRQTGAVTHRGKWGELGDSRTTLQYESTRTANCQKGTAGGGDGNCNSLTVFPVSELNNTFLNSELHTPVQLFGLGQVLTSGFEFRQEKLKDPNVAAWDQSAGEAKTFALYLEDNIGVGDDLIVTPGVRVDHHDQFGSNWSPSLNATYHLSPEWSIKGGIARVFKAPNLYQLNPGYRWSSMGNGCGGLGQCEIVGNPNLDPEISVNHELGAAWSPQNGWAASVAYFRNDYKNKIATDLVNLERNPVNGLMTTRWLNGGAALIHGLEGSLTVPLLGESGRHLKLINNFTWMFSNNGKQSGQPVSIIPKYTVNSTLDWTVNDKLSAQLTATFYGRQKPRTNNTSFSNQPATQAGLTEVASYTMAGLSGSYRFDKNNRLSFGVTNLFDKIITRKSNSTGNAGAATYNEPGRGYYVSFTSDF